jgi:hypothetical protein
MPRRTESLSEVKHWFEQHLGQMWPAVLGSLSLRRSRCVRQRCRACESGKQHSSYVLYSRIGGHRSSVYVPEDLVPEIEAALEKGRELQVLLHEAAVRYTKALKQERKHLRESLGDGKEAS